MNNILIFGVLSAITMATRHCRSNYRLYIPGCLMVG